MALTISSLSPNSVSAGASSTPTFQLDGVEPGDYIVVLLDGSPIYGHASYGPGIYLAYDSTSQVAEGTHTLQASREVAGSTGTETSNALILTVTPAKTGPIVPTPPVPSTAPFQHGDRVRVWFGDIEVTVGYDPRLSLIDVGPLGTRPERRVSTIEQPGRQGVLSSLRTDRSSATWDATTFSLPMVVNGSLMADGSEQTEVPATQAAATLLRQLTRLTNGPFTIKVQDVFGTTWIATARRTGDLPRTNNARQWLLKFSLALQLDVPMWQEQADTTFTVSGSGYIDDLEDLDAPVDNAVITLPGGAWIRDRQSGAELRNRGGETVTVMCSPTYAQNPRQGGGSLQDLYWSGLGAFTIGDGTGTPWIDHDGPAVSITCQRRTLSPL